MTVGMVTQKLTSQPEVGEFRALRDRDRGLVPAISNRPDGKIPDQPAAEAAAVLSISISLSKAGTSRVTMPDAFRRCWTHLPVRH